MIVWVPKLLIIQALLYKVMASYFPQTQQYYQVPGQHYYQIANPPVPSTIVPRPNTYASSMPSTHQFAVTAPYIDYSSYSTATPLNSYKNPDVTSLQPLKLPESDSLPNKPHISLPSTNTGFDTNVLNNLAIALQLLIVSNLLNSPVPEKTSSTHKSICQSKRNEYESAQAVNPVSTYSLTNSLNSYSATSDTPISHMFSSHLQPNEYQIYLDSNPYDQTLNSQSSLANANYLGSSNNFGGLLGLFGVPPATTRPGLDLKSPYDTLASNSFNGNIPSTSSEYTKNNLKSPYASIMAIDNYKDLFSIDF